MKVTYTALDGKTFNSEQECLAHEQFLKDKIMLIADRLLVMAGNQGPVEEVLAGLKNAFSVEWLAEDGNLYQIMAVARSLYLSSIDIKSLESLARADEMIWGWYQSDP